MKWKISGRKYSPRIVWKRSLANTREASWIMQHVTCSFAWKFANETCLSVEIRSKVLKAADHMLLCCGPCNRENVIQIYKREVSYPNSPINSCNIRFYVAIRLCENIGYISRKKGTRGKNGTATTYIFPLGSLKFRGFGCIVDGENLFSNSLSERNASVTIFWYEIKFKNI